MRAAAAAAAAAAASTSVRPPPARLDLYSETHDGQMMHAARTYYVDGPGKRRV